MRKWIVGFMLAAFVAGSAATTFAQGCDPCPAPPNPARPAVVTTLPG